MLNSVAWCIIALLYSVYDLTFIHTLYVTLYILARDIGLLVKSISVMRNTHTPFIFLKWTWREDGEAD